jgi:hypothetical protein
MSTIRMLALLAIALLAGPLAAQERLDTAALLAAQREAMKPLSLLDGVWRGTGWTIGPGGEKHTMTQTERIGPFLDGSVKVIEGRGYDAGGVLAFHAFGIVSYDPTKKSYTMRSYAMGRSGDFAFTPTAEGFTWEIPAGPAKIRYTATIQGDRWREVGDRIVPGKEPARFFEMNLARVGTTDWPAAGAVGP